MTPLLDSRTARRRPSTQPDSSHFRVAVIGLGQRGTHAAPSRARRHDVGDGRRRGGSRCGASRACRVSLEGSRVRRVRSRCFVRRSRTSSSSARLRTATPTTACAASPRAPTSSARSRSRRASTRRTRSSPRPQPRIAASRSITSSARCRSSARCATRRRANGREVVFAQVWQLMDLPPWAEPGWRGQMLRRTLYEAGVHLVDFLMALFGERPVSVTASVSTCGVRESESDAVALCTLEFSRGRLAQIIQNRLCKGETQYFEVRAETRRRLAAGLVRRTSAHHRRPPSEHAAAPARRLRRVRHGVGGDRAISGDRSAGIRRSPA